MKPYLSRVAAGFSVGRGNHGLYAQISLRAAEFNLTKDFSRFILMHQY